MKTLPTNINDIIPDSHINYYIITLINTFNFKQLNGKYNSNKGTKAYPRQLLARIIIRGILEDIQTTKDLEYLMKTNPTYIHLTGAQTPSSTTLTKFINENEVVMLEILNDTILISEKLGIKLKIDTDNPEKLLEKYKYNKKATLIQKNDVSYTKNTKKDIKKINKNIKKHKKHKRFNLKKKRRII